MKKVKLYTLQFLWLLSAVIEYFISIVVGIVDVIGNKSSELTDVLEISIEKQKAKS
jgi:hypothetical protein